MSLRVLVDDPEYPERMRGRLREERVIWLTAVDDAGCPQPNPVWFLWQRDQFLVYSSAASRRLKYLRARPRVSLHFDGGRLGRDIVVFTGTATVHEQGPRADQVPEYLDKYRYAMREVFGGTREFTESHPVLIRVRPHRVRGR